MRLSVRHNTRYTFETPVRQLIQVQRLWPSETASQQIVSWTVSTTDSVYGAGHRDGAGDWFETVSVRGPVSQVDVLVEGIVSTTETAGVLRDHREKIRPSSYLRSSHRTEPDASLKVLAADAAKDAGEGTLSLAHALSEAVADAISYVPGETQAHTTAAEALAGGAGVCQDHTHALIAVAIASNLPARYVSGYLMATEGDAVAMSEAGHAWAEIFVEGLGWVGFDPSNRCCPDDRYVRLGSGFDSVDAAPIRGLVLGNNTDEEMTVEVVVQEAEQSQQ